MDLVAEGNGSVEALADALAYFERPDRVGILRSLYSRASGSTPLPDADELIASLRTSLPAPTQTSVEEERPPFNYHKLFYAVGALVLIGLSLIGFSLFRNWDAASASVEGSSSVTSRLAASVSGAADAVGDAVVSLGQRAGLDGPSPGGGSASSRTAERPHRGNLGSSPSTLSE